MTTLRKLLDLQPGTLILGRYQVIGHLGSGGMGDVYEVEHVKLKRRFALKRLAADKAEDEQIAERFLREARAAAATGHPGIVEVFDFDHAEDGWPFLVMEKLVGQNLRERLRQGPMSEAEIVHVGTSILSALDAVHQRGILHRDIKPANVFLVPTGTGADGSQRPDRVKLVDFGLALLYGDGHDVEDLRLTKSGTMLGTPLYMSPEQVRAADVDHRTDIYSTGTLLYECVAGRPPFGGQGFASVIAQIVERRPPIKPLGECPENIRVAILKALAKDRRDRFDSAADMAAVLAGTSEPPAIPVSSPVSDTWPAEDEDPAWTSDPGDEEQPTQTISEPPPGAITADTRDLPGRPPTGRPGAEATAGTATGAAKREAVGVGAGPAGPRPWLRYGLAGLVIVGAFVASFLGFSSLAKKSSSQSADAGVDTVRARSPSRLSDKVERELDELIRLGDLAGAERLLRRASLRAPDDMDIQGRYLLVALDPERQRAFEVARKLEARELPPTTRVIVDAVLAFEVGKPLAAVPAVDRLLADQPDNLLLRYLKAHLLRYGDRFLGARVEYLAILERWPAFSLAVDGLLQRLMFLDRAKEAREVVERYIAHAPDSTNLDMLELELEIGERRYRQALQRIGKLFKQDRGRVAEFFQFQGDLEILVGNPKAAIAAYDKVGKGAKRDHYVFGALLHLGRDREARDLILATIENYPEDDKRSRLGKLSADAILLALEIGDGELARRVHAKLQRFDDGRVSQRYRAAQAFAGAVAATLAGESFEASDFPLGADSPFHVLLTARGKRADDALALLRTHTAPEGMHFSVVTTHIYMALWLEHARAALQAGALDEALAFNERVLMPRHYDASRGIVIRRAMTQHATILRALKRKGEARAIEAQMRDFGLR